MKRGNARGAKGQRVHSHWRGSTGNCSPPVARRKTQLLLQRLADRLELPDRHHSQSDLDVMDGARSRQRSAIG